MVYDINFRAEGSYRTSAYNGAEGVWDKFDDTDFGNLDDPSARISLEEEEEDGLTYASVSVSGQYEVSVDAPSREEAVELAYELAENEQFGPLLDVTFTLKEIEVDPYSLIC